MVIFLKCGPTVAILSANEGAICSYSVVLQTPRACFDNAQSRYGLTYSWSETYAANTQPTGAQCTKFQQWQARAGSVRLPQEGPEPFLSASAAPSEACFLSFSLHAHKSLRSCSSSPLRSLRCSRRTASRL